MSKRDRETNKTSETAPNAPPPPPPSATAAAEDIEIETVEEVTTAPAAPVSMEIVKTDPYAELIANADPESMAYMIPALPHKKDELLRTKRVGPGEYEEAVNGLTVAQQSAYADLTAKINPQKEFVEDGRTGIRMSTLKMDQGAGEADKRPPKSVKGAIFSTPAMEIITVPKDFTEEKNLPERVQVYVLGMYSGRQFWAPRDPSTGKPVPPAGIDLKGNAPICSSYDRKLGSRFGECKGCPYRPFANGVADRNACKDDIHLFVCMADLSGIYQINVAATSFKTCTTKISQKTDGWRVPWQGSFWLSAQLISPRPGQEFAVWTATPVTSKEEPNGVRTPDKISALLSLFARQIKTEIHLPRLASVYTGAASAAEAASEPAGEASADAIAAAAGGMDYSAQAGSGNV